MEQPNSIQDLQIEAAEAQRVLDLTDDQLLAEYPHLTEMVGSDFTLADLIEVLRNKRRAVVARYSRTQTASVVIVLPWGSTGYLDGLLHGNDRLSINSARMIIRKARELNDDELEHRVYDYLRDRFGLTEEDADDLSIALQLRIQGPVIDWSDTNIPVVASRGTLAAANDI